MNNLIQINADDLVFGESGVLIVVKMLVVLGLLMYLVFSVLVVRQVQMMHESLKDEVLQLPVMQVAWIHLLFVLVLLGLVLVV